MAGVPAAVAPLMQSGLLDVSAELVLPSWGAPATGQPRSTLEMVLQWRLLMRTGASDVCSIHWSARTRRLSSGESTPTGST